MEAQNAAREEDNDSDEVSMHGTLKLLIIALYILNYFLFLLWMFFPQDLLE